jgi:hypothetical protein
MASDINPSLISYLRQDTRQKSIIDMSESTIGSGPHVEACVVSAAQRFAVQIGVMTLLLIACVTAHITCTLGKLRAVHWCAVLLHHVSFVDSDDVRK